MTIEIGNRRITDDPKLHLKSEPLLVVYCGRGTPLGNPFRMTHEMTRDQACDKYQVWFDDQVERTDNAAFHDYMASIAMAAAVGDVHLMCWCAPQRCHCETIKEYLDAKT